MPTGIIRTLAADARLCLPGNGSAGIVAEVTALQVLVLTAQGISSYTPPMGARVLARDQLLDAQCLEVYHNPNRSALKSVPGASLRYSAVQFFGDFAATLPIPRIPGPARLTTMRTVSECVNRPETAAAPFQRIALQPY